jgi:hypothetical protein
MELASDKAIAKAVQVAGAQRYLSNPLICTGQIEVLWIRL